MCVLISEFYEQLLSLVFSLTSTQISPKMWQVFVMVKEIFDTDGFDYFTGLFHEKGAVRLHFGVWIVLPLLVTFSILGDF